MRAVMLGLFERLPERDPLRDEDDEDGRPIDDDLSLHPRPLPFTLRKGRRRPGGGQP
jgi:hypothetical protein